MSTTAIDITRHGIILPMDRIADFCRRWQVRELAVFGSYLRDDFDARSDVDFLYDFRSEARWSLWDLPDIEDDLTTIVGRSVHLVSRRSVELGENYIRRRHILSTAEPVYVER